jgi:hypothetical protein
MEEGHDETSHRIVFGTSTAICAQQKSTSVFMPPRQAQANARSPQFENQYLKIKILPGWTVAPSGTQILNLINGKYLLSINPIFTHASGIIGGRFSEVVRGKQSIEALWAMWINKRAVLNAVIAADGKSLIFTVPTSVNTISCQVGRIDANPNAVSISLRYPNYLVSAGDTITVRGQGFTSSGNAMQIGSAKTTNLSSPDGKIITFQAPAPAGSSFIQGIRIYNASVSNANGQSNSISFEYR